MADQARTKLPKLAALLDEAEEDVLAYMSFPKEHRAKLHSTDEIDKRFVSAGAMISACSGRLRPPIPGERDQAFQLNATADSGRTRPPMR